MWDRGKTERLKREIIAEKSFKLPKSGKFPFCSFFVIYKFSYSNLKTFLDLCFYPGAKVTTLSWIFCNIQVSCFLLNGKAGKCHFEHGEFHFVKMSSNAILNHQGLVSFFYEIGNSFHRSYKLQLRPQEFAKKTTKNRVCFESFLGKNVESKWSPSSGSLGVIERQ